MATSDDFPKPKYITGGCLCGSLRYRLDFPPDHDFLKESHTCQCTQCRKNTGSLWFQSHTARPLSAWQWTSSTSTLKHFRASSKAQRAFCSNCGGILYWKGDGSDHLSFAVGTVDALYLVGEGADGKEVPKEGFGFALANGGGDHLWCVNEIKGVTDEIGILGLNGRGKRWEGDDDDHGEVQES